MLPIFKLPKLIIIFCFLQTNAQVFFLTVQSKTNLDQNMETSYCCSKDFNYATVLNRVCDY